MPWRGTRRLIGPGALLLIAACSGTSGSSGEAGVAANPGGALLVTWSAPKKNTDGTPLTDLTGYTVYYGTEPGAYTKSLTIDDPTVTYAVVRGLVPGVHYFVAVASNNSMGRHSALETTGSTQAFQ